MTKNQRHKAIIKRRIFIALCIIIIAALILLAVFAVKAVTAGRKKPADSSSSSDVSSGGSSVSSDSVPDYPSEGPNGLDANYSKLLLVNGDNPLPESYNYEENLTEIPSEYINGSLKQIDKDVWPYMKAMIDAAWADGVKLYVWSPYRSYNTQNMLFQNQVKRCQQSNPSLTQSEAEQEAATVVARPGTSEHHTGLAADFNMADDKFEATEMYSWMTEHAADYGFVMRYSGEKQSITGVIHESWHWRFVGINTAKEMNRLDMCLEEYLEHIKK